MKILLLISLLNVNKLTVLNSAFAALYAKTSDTLAQSYLVYTIGNLKPVIFRP